MPKQTAEACLTQHDREIAAIRKLILQGMKMLVATQKEGRATQRELRELAAAQRVTEKKLQAFIDALGRGSGGNGKARGHGTIQ